LLFLSRLITFASKKHHPHCLIHTPFNRQTTPKKHRKHGCNGRKICCQQDVARPDGKVPKQAALRRPSK
jgi:hypothetical protein